MDAIRGREMSLQAELIRALLPVFIRRGRRTALDVPTQRERMRAYERSVPRAPVNTVTVERPLGTVPAVRISRPASQQGRNILFLHGGAYVTGSPALYRHISWRFADTAKAQFIAIDYRLAPEHPFPAALDDALRAWRALIGEGADPKHCAIMGDSAGGGLALALALRLRDAGEALPGALVAISPWTDLAITGETAQPPASDPMLYSEHLAEHAAQYLAGADPRDPYASPLYGDPRGLPPTLLQVGSDEILRADSERMAQRMRDAGCTVVLEVWPRMPHVWHAFAPILPEARRAIARVGALVQQWTALAAGSRQFMEPG
jgi:acetyl esterase/lipase